jgi:serine/threonine-protein kinase RsbW
MIRLSVPSKLEYRDLAIRMVASACKLVPHARDDFSHGVISAFSEALNNVVLHGYGSEQGEIGIEVELGHDHLTIRLTDYGRSFDPAAAPPPDLESLPESGLGVFIMRSFMDHVTYAAGVPNTLSMTKYLVTRETTA